MCEEHVRRFGWWQRFCLSQLLKWLSHGELPICYEGRWLYLLQHNYKWALYLERITDETNQLQSEDVSPLAETETGQE